MAPTVIQAGAPAGEAQTLLDAAFLSPEPLAYEAGLSVREKTAGKVATASAARDQENSLGKGSD